LHQPIGRQAYFQPRRRCCWEREPSEASAQNAQLSTVAVELFGSSRAGAVAENGSERPFKQRLEVGQVSANRYERRALSRAEFAIVRSERKIQRANRARLAKSKSGCPAGCVITRLDRGEVRVRRRKDRKVGLNIKNPEAHPMAEELSKLIGDTMTTAVTIALRERLDRVRQLQRLADRLLAIGRDCAPRL